MNNNSPRFEKCVQYDSCAENMGVQNNVNKFAVKICHHLRIGRQYNPLKIAFETNMWSLVQIIVSYVSSSISFSVIIDPTFKVTH